MLQPEILEKIHSGHQGRVRSKALARQAVFWCNINSDIDNVVNKCDQCLKTRKLPDKVVLAPHDIPNRPYEKVGADILTVLGSKYHVVIDFFSKWIEICKLPNNPKSTDLINHFVEIFSRFGFPNISFSDREPVYKSEAMTKFCRLYGISKEFSSAYHSQSNGQVERANCHVKNLIKRCNGNILKVKLCLLDYHATPLNSNLGSPHSILMNRQVRTKLPVLDQKLITSSDNDNRKLLLARQENGAKYYNKNAKEVFHSFKPGDVVVYKDGKGQSDDWKQAKVIAVDNKFRSCTLVNGNGNVITRNRAHVLPDKTGRGFNVSFESFHDPIHVPSPGCQDFSKINEPVLMPNQHLTALKPQPNPETQALPVPKTTMSPNHSIVLPRRSARIAARNSLK